LKVSFADFAVAFQDAIKGIHGPREDRDLLVFLAIYLRSPIARYFLFHTSSRWGLERTDIRLAELLTVPFLLPEHHTSARSAQRLVSEVVKKADTLAQARRAVLQDRHQAIETLQAECNDLLYEYFDIIDVERALIEDTENVVIDSILPKRASATLPTLKEATPDYRNRYVDLLSETLNDWARGGSYSIHGRSYASSGSGIATVVLDRTRNGQPPPSTGEDDAALLSVLDNHLVGLLQYVFHCLEKQPLPCYVL
jgi:hypothetical protein